MKKLFLILGMLVSLNSFAQIGYQISLLDNKTGEPRTNEKVSVSIKITDSKGAIVCDEQKSVTSDAFGVLSMTIGNANTFTNVNWNNLPLKISATVDGILVGSSDILAVPIAEYAKRTGDLTLDILAGMKVKMDYEHYITFSASGLATYNGIYKAPFEIDGNNVYVYHRYNDACWVFHYSVKNGKLYFINDDFGGVVPE